MISVCMAVKNGGTFLKEQIDSILPQIGVSDELIISDDHSTDNTLQIIKSYHDSRVHVLHNLRPGLVSNFENSLTGSRGDIIFLSDQDDVWAPHKAEIMLSYLKDFDLVVSDCMITNYKLEIEKDSFFKLNQSGTGVIRNLIKNSYMGCCMAFRREVLNKALPFPELIPAHDLWIGLIGEMHFRVTFIPEKLIYHRRHVLNASTTSGKSRFSLFEKMAYRLYTAKRLIQLQYGT
jgi:glycosyltransferase involved in cell wall biosynthesis